MFVFIQCTRLYKTVKLVLQLEAAETGFCIVSFVDL